MNPNEQPYTPSPQTPQQPLSPESPAPSQPPVAPEPPIQPATPQPEAPIAPPVQSPEVAPAPEPLTPPQPFAPQPTQQPQVSSPVTEPMPMSYEQSPAAGSNGLLGTLNEKAGLFSLIAFAVAFLILTVATLIDINNGLNELANFTANLGGNLELPSFFEVTKTAVTHWIFVNIISAWWWVVGLLPALALAGYGLFKKRFKDIPAIITVVLVLEVYLNLIIK